MRNDNFTLWNNFGLSLMTVVLVIVLGLSLLTYKASHISNENYLINLAVKYHLVIMIILVIISVAYGLVWAKVSMHRMQASTRSNKKLLDVVILFMNVEEREILNFLVKQNGTATQAEISRLPHMNRVKAFRAVQKMQEKRLVELVAAGKIRKVTLKKELLDTLNNS